MAREGRIMQPRLVALARTREHGRAEVEARARTEGEAEVESGAEVEIEILAPAVGLWRDGPAPGTLIQPGDPLGEIEILGVLHRIEAPDQARGVVVEHDHHDTGARKPVAHGQCMLVLDPGLAAGTGAARRPAPGTTTENDHGLVFRSPMSGRYYSRPAPDKSPFVAAGDTLSAGTTVCLLEVMKTFNRVTYGGDGLPDSARIKEIVPADGDDLAAGDIILVLE